MAPDEAAQSTSCPLLHPEELAAAVLLHQFKHCAGRVSWTLAGLPKQQVSELVTCLQSDFSLQQAGNFRTGMWVRLFSGLVGKLYVQIASSNTAAAAARLTVMQPCNCQDPYLPTATALVRACVIAPWWPGSAGLAALL